MSVAHKIFDYLLDKLNENTQGVTFDGNFTFKFWRQPSDKIQDFHILDEDGEEVDFKATRVVPFVDISSIEIPYNEKNRRQDWEVEYYIPIRIENKIVNNAIDIQFDYTDDRYQALMETYEDLKTNLTYTTTDMRIGFKVREPQKVAVFKHNKHYFQMFALSINISKIEKGRFGNEMKLSLAKTGELLTQLDTSETHVIMGKTERDRTLTNQLNQNYSVDTRTFEVRTTINYDDDRLIDTYILDEVMLANDANNNNQLEYDLRMFQSDSFDKTYKVIITGGVTIFTNNVPETITFTMKLSGV
jgi:hypothetical protein